MQLEQTKVTFAAVWALAASAVTIVGSPRSLLNWTVLAVVFLPPLVMLRWWNGPRQTMSENIQEGIDDDSGRTRMPKPTLVGGTGSREVRE